VQTVTVPYGNTQLEFRIADDLEVTRLELNEYPELENFEKAFEQALAEPIGSKPLRQIVNPGEKVVIIISDMTRAYYNTHAYLPRLLDELNAGGIPDKDITVVIATGYHAAATEEEKRILAGERAYQRVRIESHDCHAKNLVYFGRTANGNEVYINNTVAKADRVVLTGGISYHTFAGFGGGRKSIAPGVAGFNTIEENHKLCFGKERYTLDPMCNSGILEGNRLSEEMFEIMDMVKPCFLVNVIINDRGNFAAVVAGDPKKAYMAGVEIVKKIYGVPVKNKYDVAIISSGGYPKDINLFQAVKGLHNASFIMNQDSAVVLCCECREGIGPDGYVKGLKYSSYNALWDALNERYDPEAAISLRTMLYNKQMKVYVITDLSDEEVCLAGMIPVHSPEEAWERICADKKGFKKVAVFPCGALTFPILEG